MLVSVDILFSKRDIIGSKIISYGTAHLAKDVKERTSHTAVLINKRWVHESTLETGVRVISYSKWKELNIEVARVKLKDTSYEEIKDMYRKIKNKDYDKLGLAFFALAVIPTFIGLPLYKKNLLESDDKYFCSEVIGKLTNRYFGMSSPVQILSMLRKEN